MRVLIVSVIIVLVDQVSKFIVKGLSMPHLGINLPGMYPGQRINVWGDWFNITFVENPGIAFGIDFGAQYKLLISIFTFAATVGLIYFLFINKNKSFRLKLSVAFIIGGAVGNLIDRFFYGLIYDYAPFLYGKVVDFVDIRIFNLFLFNRTMGNYIFNIADLAVTIGVILLLFSYSKQFETEKPTEIVGQDTNLVNLPDTHINTNNILAEKKE